MSCFYFPKIFSFMHMYHIHRYIWKLESFIFFNNVHYRSKNLKSRTKYMNRPYIQYMLHKTPSQNSQFHYQVSLLILLLKILLFK